MGRWIHLHWLWLGQRWSIIIPAIFILIAIIWLIVVYRKGKFQFLPALAIARVTVLDSIGRLEVIFLLIIGVLLIAVFGFNLFYEPNLKAMMQFPAIGEQINMVFGGGEDVLLDVPDDVKAAIFCTMIGKAAMFFADVFITLIAFVLSMFLLPNEMNRGVILSILPKPLTRGEYVFGKFLGTWLLVTGCFLILAIEIYIIMFIWFATHQGGIQMLPEYQTFFPVNERLLWVMFFFPFKYATFILVVMGLTLRMPEVPAGIIGLTIFIGGHFTAYVMDLSNDFLEAGSIIFGYGLKISHWVLPHLAGADVNLMELYPTTLEYASEKWGWLWQIMVYNVILMWFLSWLFRRRSL